MSAIWNTSSFHAHFVQPWGICYVWFHHDIIQHYENKKQSILFLSKLKGYAISAINLIFLANCRDPCLFHLLYWGWNLKIKDVDGWYIIYVMMTRPWHSCLGLHLDFSDFTKYMLIPIPMHHTMVPILNTVLQATWKGLWYSYECLIILHYEEKDATCLLFHADWHVFKWFYNFLFRLLQYLERKSGIYPNFPHTA